MIVLVIGMIIKISTITDCPSAQSITTPLPALHFRTTKYWGCVSVAENDTIYMSVDWHSRYVAEILAVVGQPPGEREARATPLPSGG